MPNIPALPTDTVQYTPSRLYALENMRVDIESDSALDIYGNVYINGYPVATGAYYNVRSYGVKGDGVTDDGAAMNAALMAGAGSTVIIPSGMNVRTSIPIVVQSNTVLQGYGAKITNAGTGAGSTVLNISGVTNVCVFGLEIDGLKASYAPVTEQRHGVFVTNSTKVRLRDLYSHDNKGDGLYIGLTTTGLSEDVIVDACRFIANHRNNCSVTHARAIKFYGCTFNNASGTAPQAGVDIEPNTVSDITEDIQFFGCTANGNARDGFEVVLQPAPTGNQRNIGFYGCTASGNAVHGWEMLRPVDVKIEGGSASENGFCGVTFSGTGTNVRVNINASNNGQHGVVHSAGSVDPYVIGGTYWNNGTSADNTYNGIMCAGTAPSRAFILPGTISGNPLTGGHQMYGLRSGSGVGEITFLGCFFPNNLTAPQLLTSGTIVEHSTTGWQEATNLLMKTFGGASPAVRLAVQGYMATAGDLDYGFGIGLKPPSTTGALTVRGGTATSVAHGVDTMVNGGDAFLIRGTAMPAAYAKFIDRFVEMNELSSAPVAGVANTVRLYALDNGSGKTKLMAQFATGAAVQVAIEP